MSTFNVSRTEEHYFQTTVQVNPPVAGRRRKIPQSPKQRRNKKTMERLARSTKPSEDEDKMEAAKTLLSLRGSFPKAPCQDDIQVEDEEEEEAPLAEECSAAQWTDGLASQWPQNNRALYEPLLDDLKRWTRFDKADKKDLEKKHEIIKHLNRWPGLDVATQKAVRQDLNNWPFVGRSSRQVILRKALEDLDAKLATSYNYGKDRQWCSQLKKFLELQLERPGATRKDLADLAAANKKFTRERIISRERLWIQARYIVPSDQGKFAKVPGLLEDEGTRRAAIQYCETAEKINSKDLAIAVTAYWAAHGGRPVMGKNPRKDSSTPSSQTISVRTARDWINELGYGREKRVNGQPAQNYPTPPQSRQGSANGSPSR